MPYFPTMSPGVKKKKRERWFHLHLPPWVKWEWNQLKITTHTLSVYFMVGTGVSPANPVRAPCIWEAAFGSQASTPRQDFSVLFLSLSNSILKIQLNWGSNLWCDEKRKPRAAPSAAGLTEAGDGICGLAEMMCSISHPNELYFIIGAHCHQSGNTEISI